MKRSPPWPHINALYQLSVQSFQDTTGDGVGDLRGIIERLPYLKESLGVDAMWLTPFTPSGGLDFGYDVTKYLGVDPEYGDLNDLRELVDRAHALQLAVMVDVVLNHTSDQHAWFRDSRSSRTSEKRHWYIWSDPKPDGSPPNNWYSKFGGSAWTLDETTGQYYLHTFFKQQPDLNWDNPEVRRAMHAVIRWWLNFGVDGLRVDAAIYISKGAGLRDNPLNPDYEEGDDERHRFVEENISYGPHMAQYLKELTDIVKQYDKRLMLFEAYPEGKHLSVERYTELYEIDPSVSAPLMLEGLWTPLDAVRMRDLLVRFHKNIDPEVHCVLCSFGNHDRSRIVSRFGEAGARLVALLELSLPGVPIIYYGDELGMVDANLRADQRRDHAYQNHMPFGRDSARTPMQWDATASAGFTSGPPWLPVHTNYHHHNVQEALRDDDSLLMLYRELLFLRRTHVVFRTGSFEAYGLDDEAVFAFERRNGDQHVFVVLNFSEHETKHTLPHPGKILCSTHKNSPPEMSAIGELYLKPFEGVIVECKEHKLTTGGGDENVA